MTHESIFSRGSVVKLVRDFYYRFTSEKYAGLWLLTIIGVYFVSASVMVGLVFGGVLSHNGNELLLSDLWSVELLPWESLGEGTEIGHVFARGVYGFFHWFTVILIAITVWASEAGYAYPMVARVSPHLFIPIHILYLLLLTSQGVRMSKILESDPKRIAQVSVIAIGTWAVLLYLS